MGPIPRIRGGQKRLNCDSDHSSSRWIRGKLLPGGEMQTYDELLKTSARLSRVAPLTIVLVGIAIVAARADDITGPVAKAEPPSKQDGTLAHPYADANQCPPSTDIVIWPEEWRSIPSIPAEFSVCFVGSQSKENHVGPDAKVRDR
jgi:hypothetical protein